VFAVSGRLELGGLERSISPVGMALDLLGRVGGPTYPMRAVRR
jgi:hypothetical protein